MGRSLQEMDAEIAALEKQLVAQEERISRLEKLIAAGH